MEAQRSLISELEGAIASGSSEQRLSTLRRVTDLFLIGAEVYSDSQVDVFDDVIARLADRIETKAKAELARRLAPVPNAPRHVVRTLAYDESIEVAGPVLSQSVRITEEDLIACARNSSQDKLLAISKRAAISETISDVLVTRGDRQVVRSVAQNNGARLSKASFGKLVEKSHHDTELAVSVGSRQDISREHFQAIVAKASEAVLQRLTAANPAVAGEIKQVLSGVTGRAIEPARRAKLDYTQARAWFDRLKRAGESIEPAVHDCARSNKLEETIVALSTLCQLPITIVEKLVVDKRTESDLILILAKASGFSWPTAKLILLMHRAAIDLPAPDMDTTQEHFERLQPGTAQRVVRFYQVRHASDNKAN
jgi:uncharacterized protein (DUF2336 family)